MPTMAGKTREIKGRIKAVGNIERITKTMQMIATARFQAMQRRATSAQAYTRKIGEIVGELASSLAGDAQVRNPLLSQPEPRAGRRLLLVITSNRGLCGAYNANVLRTAMKYVGKHDAAAIDVQVVGKKALSFFKFNGIEVSQFHSQIGDTPAFEDVHRMAQQYMDDFTAGKYDAVDICFTAFESMSRQTAQVQQLLPLENPAAKQEGNEAAAATNATAYDFTPSPEELLNELLPITVKTQLFQYFNEAVVSEQLARMVAMKSATDAAGKMKKSLQREFNRARQAAITTELTEIIGGVAALE